MCNRPVAYIQAEELNNHVWMLLKCVVFNGARNGHYSSLYKSL